MEREKSQVLSFLADRDRNRILYNFDNLKIQKITKRMKERDRGRKKKYGLLKAVVRGTPCDNRVF